MKKNGKLQFTDEELMSLSDAAYEKIKAAIVGGEIGPGSRISERELSIGMGVSTTTVKRALHRLSLEGVVEILPRKGTYVSEFFSSSMEENTIIRAYLEGLAARFAAEKADEPVLAGLREQIELMRERTEKGSLSKLAEANTRFHRLIHEAGRNPYIGRLIDVIRTFDLKFRQRALADREEAKRGFKEHYEVFSAISDGDGPRAEELMKKHILRTLSFVMAKKDEPS